MVRIFEPLFRRLVQSILKHKLFILFTLGYFAFSFLTYKDYGTTFDEKVEYDAGKFLISYFKEPTTIAYVSDLINNKPANIELRHLPLFSVYSRVYPALLNLFNPNFYLEWFHLENLILGYGLFLFSYLLFFLHYKDETKAVIAPIFIALTPVILGHIPANSKDIPFATGYLLGILAIYYFNVRKSDPYFEILMLGLIFGVVQSQRAVGITLLLSYFVLELFSLKSLFSKDTLHVLLKIILIFLISLLVWVICLPLLGVNLPVNLVALFKNAASYSDWNHQIIYFGNYLFKDQRPWHYLFVYLLIKLPISIILVLFSGLALVFMRKLVYGRKHPLTLLTLLVILNVLPYVILHPVVYNGIRHFLYLVVCLVLISAFLFLDIYNMLRLRYRRYLLGAFILYSLFVVFRMIHLHPYEYIYYNEAVGGLKGASGKFETEYWGAAYKEGSEYVRDMLRGANISGTKVFACDNQYAVVYYSQFVFEVVGSSKEADIIICDLHKDALSSRFDESHPIINTINREGVPIFNIRVSKEWHQ